MKTILSIAHRSLVYQRSILLSIIVASFSFPPVLASAQTVEWLRQLGTSVNDVSRSVSADAIGYVYVTGSTWGNLGDLNAGDNDTFLAKYDAGGTLLWTEQLGTSGRDSSLGVSSDGLGNVYISGYTSGNLGGSNTGYDDAFVSKYDAAGTLLWTKQLGTITDDWSHAVLG